MTHAATLWFGAFRSRTTWGRTLSPRAWTCVGAVAIPLWASLTWGLLLDAVVIVTAGVLSRADR
jgi:hypothetical protein